MSRSTLTLHDLTDPSRPAARGLTLAEAFARVMALAGRERWAFPRTARVMHLVLIPCHTDDPIFDSSLAIDSQARDDIMAQVCAHGFGQFRITTDEHSTITGTRGCHAPPQQDAIRPLRRAARS
jgi:hypothetical protein